MAETLHVIHGRAATWSAIGAMERIASAPSPSHRIALIGPDERLRLARLAPDFQDAPPRALRRGWDRVIAWDEAAHVWCKRRSLEAAGPPQDIPIDVSRLESSRRPSRPDGVMTIGWIDDDDDEGRRHHSDFFIIITAAALAQNRVRGIQVHGPHLAPALIDSLEATGVNATVTRVVAPPWQVIPACDLMAVAPHAATDSAIVKDLLNWSAVCNVPVMRVHDQTADHRRRRFQLAQAVVEYLADPEPASPIGYSQHSTEFEDWLNDFVGPAAIR